MEIPFLNQLLSGKIKQCSLCLILIASTKCLIKKYFLSQNYKNFALINIFLGFNIEFFCKVIIFFSIG